MFSKYISLLLFSTLFICFELSDCIDVKTSSGTLRGNTYNEYGKTIYSFIGVPYAEPPVGKLRFAKPEPIKARSGIIDATKQRSKCYQGGNDTSEDCLFLNVWTTQMTGSRPVLIWIHGGGLNGGGTGPRPSAQITGDLVMVSIQYRLGQLGFLYGGQPDAPGNVGFFDQQLAIKWVRDNIHLFGGNKDEITIAGNSAGSWSVSAQIIAPSSKGLFKRAILQSGAQIFNKDRPIRTKEDALADAKKIAKDHHCPDAGWLDCLRKLKFSEFLKYRKDMGNPIEGTEFLPLGALQAFKQKKYNEVDLIAGCTHDEGSLLAGAVAPSPKPMNEQGFLNSVKFTNTKYHNVDPKKVTDYYLKHINKTDPNAVKWAYYDFTGDVMMKCPTYFFAKLLAEHSPNKNVFFYELTYKMANWGKCDSTMGVCHTSEGVFVGGGPIFTKGAKPQDVALSKEMMGSWINFVKTGKTDPKWSRLSGKIGSSKVLEANPNRLWHNMDNPFKSCDELWKEWFIG